MQAGFMHNRQTRRLSTAWGCDAFPASVRT
jgi:hypothetical protein